MARATWIYLRRYASVHRFLVDPVALKMSSEAKGGTEAPLKAVYGITFNRSDSTGAVAGGGDGVEEQHSSPSPFTTFSSNAPCASTTASASAGPSSSNHGPYFDITFFVLFGGKGRRKRHGPRCRFESEKSCVDIFPHWGSNPGLAD